MTKKTVKQNIRKDEDLVINKDNLLYLKKCNKIKSTENSISSLKDKVTALEVEASKLVNAKVEKEIIKEVLKHKVVKNFVKAFNSSKKVMNNQKKKEVQYDFDFNFCRYFQHMRVVIEMTGGLDIKMQWGTGYFDKSGLDIKKLSPTAKKIITKLETTLNEITKIKSEITKMEDLKQQLKYS